jgi:hypothetical protein
MPKKPGPYMPQSDNRIDGDLERRWVGGTQRKQVNHEEPVPAPPLGEIYATSNRSIVSGFVSRRWI